MSESLKSKLRVEGEDDKFSVIHLLERHGIDFDARTRLVDVDVAGNDVKLLVGIEPSIRAATDRAIGFVVDANASLQKRWKDIRERLSAVSINAPEDISRDGFIASPTKFRSRVGVWIMPDNEHDGQIEDFLATLINDKDPLIGHAQEATKRAKTLGAKFSDSDQSKAIVRAWLAWQYEPGHPYGRAIQRKYFNHQSDVVNRFVAWFKNLYSVV